MDLATARQHIQVSLDRMRGLDRRPLFDEWAVLSLAARPGGVLAYSGPRADSFRQQLPKDAEPLRALAAGKHFADGDIEFALDAGGTHYDAFMKLGPVSYLVCNHTGKTMDDIRRDARWTDAQSIFFELSEKFRQDPLSLPAGTGGGTL